jgi:hypothetical protein
MAGRSVEAVEVCLAGVEVARQFGALGGLGIVLLVDAAVALLSLGRWGEAERLLAEVFDLDLRSPSHRLVPLTAWGQRAGVWRRLHHLPDQSSCHQRPARPRPESAADACNR